MDRTAGRAIKNETLHALLADAATVLLHFAEVHHSFVATASGATDHAAELPPAAFRPSRPRGVPGGPPRLAQEHVVVDHDHASESHDRSLIAHPPSG
jgi:hypothetical protein